MTIAMLAFLVLLASPNPAPAQTTELAAAPSTTPNECTFQWEVQARGVTLGITQDTVSWTADSSRVVSVFTPNAMASLLGAPMVERLWTSSKVRGIVREENKYQTKNAPYNVRWTIPGTKMWKNVNQQPREEFPAPAPVLSYIDSSVFPYLELVGLPIINSPSQAWVLNQKEPYQATLKKTDTTAEYNAGNKRGTVWVNAGKPTKLSFTEGTETFESRVVSSKCK